MHLIVAEASNAGVIEESERAIISGVVRLADRPVREVMTPRTDIEWIDCGADAAAVATQLAAMPHSRMPVADGSVDDIVGVVQARDVVAALIAGDAIDLRALMRTAPVVPDQMDAMDALADAARCRGAGGAGPRRIWPFRRDRDARPICSPRSPASSPPIRTRAPIRRCSSARTAAG